MGKLIALAEKEIIRAEILEICQQGIPVGVDERVVKAALRKCGHDLNEREVMEQLDYLHGKGLLELTEVNNKVLGIQRVVARITSAGIDCLEGNVDAAGVGVGG